MTRCFLPSLVFFAVVQSADASTWGSCDIWNREKRGCSIPSGHLCSSYLSNGPPGATFEIVLSGLPASTASSPVHVSWWAPHEAVGYDPRQKSQTITVYKNISAAYPTFSSNDFNGGNVRVNETGHAKLRFKAPSTYYMWRPFWIPYPHINVRLCYGQSFMMYRSERIEFKLGTVRVQACGSQGTYRDDEITKLAPIPTSSSTPATSTTSRVFLSTTSPSSLIQTPDTNADGSFDWGALEFSPVYQCIQSNMLYNYFLQNAANYCVGTCPQYAAAQHGQCVRKSTNVLADFNVSWSLLVQCDQACWNAKISRTRHGLRLAAADHLDITFQEVEKMVLRPGSFSSRRLQTVPVSSATLFVSVKTNRFYDVQDGRNLLKSFLPSVQVASAILGLTVQSMQVDTGVGLPNGNLLNGEDTDEFTPIYNQALGVSGNTGGQFGNTSTEGLPTGAIIAGIVGVVLLGPIGVILFWYKRRQRRNFAKNMAAVQAKQVEGDDIEGDNSGVLGQDDHKKTKPSATKNVGDNNEADTIQGRPSGRSTSTRIDIDPFGESTAQPIEFGQDDNEKTMPSTPNNVGDNNEADTIQCRPSGRSTSTRIDIDPFGESTAQPIEFGQDDNENTMPSTPNNVGDNNEADTIQGRPSGRSTSARIDIDPFGEGIAQPIEVNRVLQL